MVLTSPALWSSFESTATDLGSDSMVSTWTLVAFFTLIEDLTRCLPGLVYLILVACNMESLLELSRMDFNLIDLVIDRPARASMRASFPAIRGSWFANRRSTFLYHVDNQRTLMDIIRFSSFQQLGYHDLQKLLKAFSGQGDVPRAAMDVDNYIKEI
jgi:hypothetical protein